MTPPKPRLRVTARADGTVLGVRPAPPATAGARSYKAARPDRLAPFLMGDLAPASVLARDLPGLIAHARDAARNNDYVRGYLGLVRRHVVGPKGPALQSLVEHFDGRADDLPRRIIEREWTAWGAWGQPTLCGRLSLRDLEQMAVITAAAEGNFLARFVRGRRGGAWGFKVQVLSIDHLDLGHNADRLRGGGYVRNGVECDADDRVVAYHLFAAPRGDAEAHHRRGVRERVPADQVLHLYLPEEPLQTIGRPWLHTALRRLNMVDKLEEAALAAARYGAAKMIFFKRPEDDGPTPAGDHASPVEEVEAGETGVLPPGWDIAPFDPTYPSTALDGFVAGMLRGSAVGARVSYSALTNDLKGASFSSLRAGLSEERDEWRTLQAWFHAAFMGRLFAAWLPMAMAAGRLAPLRDDDMARYARHTWRGRGWQSITPREEAQTAETLLANRLAAPSDLAAERGYDFEELVERYAADVETLRAAGLSLPVASGGPQPDAGGVADEQPPPGGAGQ
ncbi:MAG: phage portal protein [Rubrimonas sp.]